MNGFCSAHRLPVPNMIADLDQAPKERVDKPVWRVAFFGRLEERKGIKLFVDAVQVRAHAAMCLGLVNTTALLTHKSLTLSSVDL
jgi:hypothetical protein